MSRPEDDIVTRLREATQVYANQWHEECREAAEEIERLRGKVAYMEAILDAVNDDIGSDYLDLIAEGLES